MTPRFHRLSLAEFTEVLASFDFVRRINAVHMHHTWRPNHAQFKGHESIVAMWRYHTQTKGWSDIAQHITIDPEGMIWTGRNWNRAPASAAGHNGSSQAGPFMFELIGDFDVGQDRFDGPQRDTALKVTALVLRHWNLPAERLLFHRSMSDKTCPGSSIDLDGVVAEVRDLLTNGFDPAPAGARGRGAARGAPGAGHAINDVLEDLMRYRSAPSDPADAELDEQDVDLPALGAIATAAGAVGRQAKPTPAELATLRPFVINLRQGVFSDDGEMTTSPGDVDAIFEEHLPKALEAARNEHKPLRIVFYAHGGLVAESSALLLAHEHVRWWRANDVYPIYFVWETGLFETIGQLLERARARSRAAARDVADFTTDLLLEAAVRALGGPTIWGGMKRSAQRASATEGGARYAAGKLGEFCRGKSDVELHAVGHSAGAIFHAHFLPTALDAGAPKFASLHLLAPAIRIDLFRARLMPLLGNGIDHTTVFTMLKDLERADNCARIYRKSLLYLISRALEDKRKEPILGLEESLREDLELRRVLGLGAPSQTGEIVWSTTAAADGRSASRSTTHGGFDNDAATMSSVARRVVSLPDAEPLKERYPRQAERGIEDEWTDAVDWPEGLELLPSAAPTGPARPPPLAAAAKPAAGGGNGGNATGRRVALCVGVDDYAQSPLSGCARDARLWASTFEALGFEPPIVLLDGHATRSAILDALGNLLDSSIAGDVVAFQFSGHGTQVPDVDGDEENGDTPGLDEALCPHDMDSGAFLIDDDMADVLDRTPPGVNVTLFIDCCHSGTVSRIAVGTPKRRARRDERPRFIRPTQEAIEAHIDFRARLGAARSRSSGPESMREVLISACTSRELAWESDGQGEFTLRATRELRKGIDGVSHEAFVANVLAAFGAQPRQHPELDCAQNRRRDALLQPLGGTGGPPAAGSDQRERRRVAELLRELAAQFE